MVFPEIGGSIEEFNIFEQIGRGGFGVVRRAQCRNTNKEVAIKQISKSSLTKEKIIERVRQEVSIHSKLDHPSILKLYTFFEDDQYVYLVLELCPNGHMLQNPPFTESQAREYLSQVVDGMLYLHSQGIMHRDLSLQNLLLDSKGRIKIADFGLATQLRRPEDKHMTMCGTPNYISPEIATRSSHGLEADVWSLGILLYTMLVGKPPFERKNAKLTLTNVVMGTYKIPDTVSANAQDLIHRCLKKNPRERIKLRDVPNHPFFICVTDTRSYNTYSSDSGVYTISTNATTHLPKAALAAIEEDGEFPVSKEPSYGIKTSWNQRREMPLDSPPVLLRPNPNEQPYQQPAGMFGSLKKKFIGLPALNKNEFTSATAQVEGCFPTYPSDGNYHYNLPLSSKRERDVSEEKLKERRYLNDCEPRREYGAEAYNSNENYGVPSYELNSLDPRSRYDKFHNRDEMLDSHGRRQLGSDCPRTQGRNRGLKDRRSISSDSHIDFRKKGFDNDFRSNSLDRYPGEQRCNRGDHRDHYPDCRCSEGNEKSDEHRVCSFCRSSQHRSWCDRHKKVEQGQLRPTNNRSCHSHSSNPESRNADILGDIEPIKRTPSPPPSKLSALSHCQSKPKPAKLSTANSKTSLREQCSPLSSRRLKATRQESKNAILNILDDGEVCVEFLQVKKSQKRVVDVCRISPDGLRIVLYQPNGSYGTVISKIPPRIPDEGAQYIFSYDNLPRKFWKKYIYAARFVTLVKEKTPKVTYYSDQSQCILMENSPNPDFVVKFFSGEKLLISNGQIHLTPRDGKQIVAKEGECSSVFDGHYMSFYEHAVKMKDQCLTLENVLTELENTQGFPSFPVIVGKRPSVSGSSFNVLKERNEGKENISPISVQSSRSQNTYGQFDPYEASVSSLASGVSRCRNPLAPMEKTSPHTLFVENVGWLIQENGVMTMKYLDGSSIKMNPYQPSGFTFTDYNNKKCSYTLSSPSVPSTVKEKLCLYQKALLKLNQSNTKSISPSAKNYSNEVPIIHNSRFNNFTKHLR